MWQYILTWFDKPLICNEPTLHVFFFCYTFVVVCFLLFLHRLCSAEQEPLSTEEFSDRVA